MALARLAWKRRSDLSKPGKKADLVVLDYNNAFMTPIHHPVSAIVYSALGHEVSTVMIDGRFVMRDGVVTGVNEAAVRRQAQISADDLARRSGSDNSRSARGARRRFNQSVTKAVIPSG